MTSANSLFPAYKLDLQPRIARNYADWSLDEETYAKHLKSRLAVGVSDVDVWNFLEYIAVVAANGINYLGIRAAGFRDFKNRGSGAGYPEFDVKSMDDVLSEMVVNFTAHASDDDAFYSIIGKEALDRSLRNFFLLFPYLYDDFMAEDGYADKPPAINLDDLDKDKKYAHLRQRETFGVSRYDAIRFDLYFAEVLGTGFKILSEISHGHPVDLTYEDWQAQLLSISDNFFAYHRGDTDRIDPEIIDLFVQRFPSFWD